MSDSDEERFFPRETVVHVNIVVGAWALLTLVSAMVSGPAVSTAVSVGFAAIAFGGSHLYLWFRGEDGEVPVGSRARWVLTLYAIVALFFIFNYFGDSIHGIVGLDPGDLGFATGLLLLVGYFVVEGRAAYRDSYPEE
ncbi:hypothetical protein [Haloarchaeobius iranensis]|uniref:Uncharacterized protein n=1 Tax=Haloarchaeobius iranensis TaxID=996166 RepID=A0A1G9W691_9EURY|nr:hypothetical protein [Haloarchaeobius iranensis]SDM80009.1 hypothetical protein SAMN05192554_107178 [Haloarchaeobius iranensis]